MESYLARATGALTGFRWAAARTRAALDAAPSDPALADPLRARTADALARVDAAANALDNSFTQIAHTSLDVVDLQARLEGEGAALAAALRRIEDLVAEHAALRVALEDQLVALAEQAAGLAAATFPGAVDGLDVVNRTLWDFHGPVWKAYERKLAEVVAKGRLTTTQIAAVQQTAAEIKARFDAVNGLLNRLAVADLAEQDAVVALVTEARANLASALQAAGARARDAYKPFRGVLGQAERIAERLDRQLRRCLVPIFPPAAALDDAARLVDGDLYASLTGVARFALLNILASLRAVRCDDGSHLLDARYVQRVSAVFPDRVYLEGTPTLLDVLDALTERGHFVRASPALHRFRDGSVKQRQFRRGNVQLSYAREGPLVRVDADIDLYRSPLRHLFGEVLVNHLTGRTTDQFAVWDTLAARQVEPIGGFRVLALDQA